MPDGSRRQLVSSHKRLFFQGVADLAQQNNIFGRGRRRRGFLLCLFLVRQAIDGLDHQEDDEGRIGNLDDLAIAFFEVLGDGEDMASFL